MICGAHIQSRFGAERSLNRFSFTDTSAHLPDKTHTHTHSPRSEDLCQYCREAAEENSREPGENSRFSRRGIFAKFTAQDSLGVSIYFRGSNHTYVSVASELWLAHKSGPFNKFDSEDRKVILSIFSRGNCDRRRGFSGGRVVYVHRFSLLDAQYDVIWKNEVFWRIIKSHKPALSVERKWAETTLKLAGRKKAAQRFISLLEYRFESYSKISSRKNGLAQFIVQKDCIL